MRWESARQLAAVAIVVSFVAAGCSFVPASAPPAEAMRSVAADLARVLADAKAELAQLAALPDAAPDSPRCSATMADRIVGLPQYTAFGSATAAGALTCVSTPGATPVDISDRAYFQRAMTTHDFAVGDYQIGRVTNKRSIGLGYPLGPASAPIGIVLAPIDLDWLAQHLAALPLADGAELVVIDSKGVVVGARPATIAATWVGTGGTDVSVVQEMLKAPSGSGVHRGLDGTARLYSWLAVDGSSGNLRVAVGIPTS